MTRSDSGDQRMPPAIFLMGPTASGKTALAMKLVERFPCEIISVDSAMVYRGMDIGTAKPSADELARAPHRLIDICEPGDSYSAARFRQDALAAMAEITANGKVPLLVGGTMLYFRALERGLADLPDGDQGVRARLESEAAELGWEALHRRLGEVDPIAAERIHPNDPQRIQRALEVFELTGSPLSQLQSSDSAGRLEYRLCKLALAPGDRSLLHARIERRFLEMLEQGFEQEVRALMARGDLDPGLPAMRSVGYRQMLYYLRGEWDRETMIRKGIIATRQLAKRQYTWLRSDPEICWLDPADGEILQRALKLIEAAFI